MTLQAKVELSRHARHRGAQSNLSDRDIDLVRRYGVLEHRTGVRFYFVGKREVERYCCVEPRLRKLHDIVLIVSSDDTCVITVYRNRKALKDIRRKSKVRYGMAA
ncbi:MAG: hypothetical protein ABI670_00820 [Chloroflexota bacterium]